MLIKNSISSTKKFFHKTIENFKSLFSGGYQKLPKTPQHTDQWDHAGKYKTTKRRRREKKPMLDSATDQGKDVPNGISSINFSKTNQRDQKGEHQNRDLHRMKWVSHQKKREKVHEWDIISKGRRQERNWVMEQKLKELEKLDVGNVDYVLDIEEVLHYYSRLTCPAYREIVEQFFMDMWPEIEQFFSSERPQYTTQTSVNSRLRIRSVRS